MRIVWRWDQGHSDYLRFDSLKRQAQVFASSDGLDLRTHQAGLKQSLVDATGLDYPSPSTHGVWRQYKRTFQLGLLVDADDANRVRPTAICKLLAADSGPGIVADDFFLLFANRFCLPFPGFSEFEPGKRTLYPAAALLKLMLAKGPDTPNFSLTAQDALNYVEGNSLTGLEDIYVYRHIEPIDTEFQSNDERRQVREFLSFLTQISWLYWEDRSMKLAATVTESFLRQYSSVLKPDIDIARLDRRDAFAALTSVPDRIQIAASPEEDSDHILFFEGNRRAVTHLRVERNRRLRRALFASLQQPAICDVCGLSPRDRYPWVGDFFDIHHLLPLSSPVARDERGTLLSDIKPICPNCHRAVHEYYGIYLRRKMQVDFLNRTDAVTAYQEAKERIPA